MLDEKRVKLMTKLALYEETQGKDDFKVSEYYRKDYVGMHMICTFLWVTTKCIYNKKANDKSDNGNPHFLILEHLFQISCDFCK